jgi:hypothetical protein
MLVEGPQDLHYLKKAKKGQELLVYIANSQTLTQTLVTTSSKTLFPPNL